VPEVTQFQRFGKIANAVSLAQAKEWKLKLKSLILRFIKQDIKNQ
jgi:hypothetical protein